MGSDIHLVIESGSVEEALDQASKQWLVSPGYLSAEVVDEEKPLWGLFGKTKLKVRVTPQKPLLTLKSHDMLTKLMEMMELRVRPELHENSYMITLEGQDADILVGRHGDGLKALEYLLNLMLRSPGDEPRIRLDSGGYRARRQRSLERLAEATARKVVERGAPVRLNPMLSWERWVIHSTLKDRSDVETQSIGESSDRKVVVTPKISAADRQDSARARVKVVRRRYGRR